MKQRSGLNGKCFSENFVPPKNGIVVFDNRKRLFFLGEAYPRAEEPGIFLFERPKEDLSCLSGKYERLQNERRG